MIYRIEKFDVPTKSWIILFSSSNFKTADKMFDDVIQNNPVGWYRLTTIDTKSINGA